MSNLPPLPPLPPRVNITPTEGTATPSIAPAPAPTTRTKRPRKNLIVSFYRHVRRHPHGAVWYLLLLGPLTAGSYFLGMWAYRIIANPRVPTADDITATTSAFLWAGLIISFVLVLSIRAPLRNKRLVEKHTKKLPADEKLAFEVKQQLLENETLVEFYAPSKAFTRKWDAQRRKPRPAFKNSLYKDALRGAYNRHSNDPPNQYTDIVKQINSAANNIRTVALLDGANEYDGNHFKIILNLAGNDEKRVSDLGKFIKSQLQLHSIEEREDGNYATITFIGHRVKPEDKLLKMRVGSEFFNENPASKLTLIPLAVTAEGEPWSLPMHHTLVYGLTGAGKGSVIQGLIRQLAPFVMDGTCVMYGIDPKATELEPLKHSLLFTAVATSLRKDEDTPVSEAEELLAHVHSLMIERASIKNNLINLEEGELMRNLSYTKEFPLVTFFVDELYTFMQSLSKESKSQLTDIMNMGRSLGVIVIAATQSYKSEILGAFRENFGNVVVLRIKSKYFNNELLGEDADKLGFDATAIPQSTPANGYASAGVAYVREETGNPLKVRFAYMSDKDVALLIKTTLDPNSPLNKPAVSV